VGADLKLHDRTPVLECGEEIWSKQCILGVPNSACGCSILCCQECTVATKGSSLEDIELELSPIVLITHRFKSCKVSSSCSEVSSSSSYIY